MLRRTTAALRVHERVLVTGCLGQIGIELVRSLRNTLGVSNVIGSDVRLPQKGFYREGPFTYVDVLNYHTLAKVAVDNGVTCIILNSSIQSSTGENNHKLALDIHAIGIRNVLKLAAAQNIKVVLPSSIAVYSPESGTENLVEDTIKLPKTIYGITKNFQEMMGEYYHNKFGVDFRCLRYPGIVSTLTPDAQKHYQHTVDDYPIRAFYELKKGSRNLTVGMQKDRLSSVLYINDCIDATQRLMFAPQERLTRRIYNLEGLPCSPSILEKEIQKHVPDFTITSKKDWMDDIAKSWPVSTDAAAFKADMGWEPRFTMEEVVADMLCRVNVPNVKLWRTAQTPSE